MAIKNLIFDMGNVLLDVQLHETVKFFAQHSDKNFKELFTLEKQMPEFDLFETGKIDSDTFKDSIKKLLSIEELDDELFYQGWHSMLGAMPKEKIEYVLQLKNAGYRTFLFSNTNALHIGEIQRRLSQDDRWDLFQQAFETHYYSFKMGMRKPGTEGFVYILEQENLNPEETLFIDDNADNIIGAQQTGLKTLRLDMGKQMDIYALNNEIFQPR